MVSGGGREALTQGTMMPDSIVKRKCEIAALIRCFAGSWRQLPGVALMAGSEPLLYELKECSRVCFYWAIPLRDWTVLLRSDTALVLDLGSWSHHSYSMCRETLVGYLQRLKNWMVG